MLRANKGTQRGRRQDIASEPTCYSRKGTTPKRTGRGGDGRKPVEKRTPQATHELGHYRHTYHHGGKRPRRQGENEIAD